MSLILRTISRRIPLLSRRVRNFSVHQRTLQLSDLCADAKYANNVAIIDKESGLQLTYSELNVVSANLAVVLSKSFGKGTEGSVGAFNKSSVSCAVAMLAAWKLGKIFVPLSVSHTENEINHIVMDSKIAVICASSQEDINDDFLNCCTRPIIDTEDIFRASASLTQKSEEDEALFKMYLTGADSSQKGSITGECGALTIYTSGTTGRPKGVLHTHNSLYHMTTALVDSWKYTSQDKILHFLPLYHVHGLVNKLLCVLYAGGTVEFLPSAAGPVVWKRFAEEERTFKRNLTTPDPSFKPVTLLMAVPTVYARMLEGINKEDPADIADAVEALKRLRLMVCGSAALPDSILLKWEKLTGYKLLERYGMTELGMALSNPYEGERRQGYVGLPLPEVSCRLVDDQEQLITSPNTPGELRVKGPNVFKEYLNRPDATKESFDPEGWFKTGDVAEVAADGYYKILGRNSSDIIKSSGYKLSALEIERELLAHPQILECAVVGVPDVVLGEKVLAILVLRPAVDDAGENKAVATDLTTIQDDAKQVKQALQTYLQDKLAPYKQPREFVFVEAIPRNHMGKVNKKSLRKDLGLE